MNTDLSIITLILDASLLVQLVMLALLLISFYSWFLIFKKRAELS
ncbi:MAG TPA: protein TolQ, partial [Gammaproteobacteria bacterium]|nr:protein TolQ [Gammaproteobacteria bacterium]